MRQVATTTSAVLPSIPTITIDILQPPYVSLHSITARNAQAPEPTRTASLVPFNPILTFTLRSHPEPELATYGLQTTKISSALHRWTEVPVASSASCLTRITNITQTEWDCTAICGALNEAGECSEVAGCVELGKEKAKGGKPSAANSAGSARLSGHMVVAVMILMVGVWMVL
jgi:hypothetical protein